VHEVNVSKSDKDAQVCFEATEVSSTFAIYTFPCIGTINAFLNVNADASSSANLVSRKWTDGTDTQFFQLGLSSVSTGDVVHSRYVPSSSLEHEPDDTLARFRVVATTETNFLASRVPDLPNHGNMETTLLEDEAVPTAEVTLEFAPSVVGAVDTYEVWTRSGLIDDRDQRPILPCGLDSLFVLDEEATAQLNQSRIDDGGATGSFRVTHDVESTSDEPFFIAVRVRRAFAEEGEYDAIYKWQRIGDSASSIALSLAALVAAIVVHVA
jgi:hypothetical protein